MVEAVCRAINHLSIRCPSNQILFAQFHTVRALHHAMQHHLKEIDTLYLIWRSLFVLITGTINPIGLSLQTSKILGGGRAAAQAQRRRLAKMGLSE